jgi:DNA-binding MarR family transcriptional regulator
MKPLDQHKRREQMGLTIYGEILLDMVSRGKIAVMDLIKLAEESNVARQATLHKTIKSLADDHFIHLRMDDGDNRVRICSIAQRGTIYLNSLK